MHTPHCWPRRGVQKGVQFRGGGQTVAKQEHRCNLSIPLCSTGVLLAKARVPGTWLKLWINTGNRFAFWTGEELLFTRNFYDRKSVHLNLNPTGMVSTDSRVCLIIVHLTSGEGNMWFPGNKEELRHGGDIPGSPMPQCAGSGSDRESKCWGLSLIPPTGCAAVSHCSSS